MAWNLDPVPWKDEKYARYEWKEADLYRSSSSVDFLSNSYHHGCDFCGFILDAAKLVQDRPNEVFLVKDGAKRLVKVFDWESSFRWDHYVHIFNTSCESV